MARHYALPASWPQRLPNPKPRFTASPRKFERKRLSYFEGKAVLTDNGDRAVKLVVDVFNKLSNGRCGHGLLG
jgi:hypothetical protein